MDPDQQGDVNHWEAPDLNDSDWLEINVPGTWEEQGFFGRPDDLDISNEWEYNGIAWYRRQVEIPRGWSEYDLALNLGRVDDAATVFFNGVEIGRTERHSQSARFSIGSETVSAGQRNLLTVRVTNLEGPGGFISIPVTLAPVTPWFGITIEFDDTPGTYFFPAGEPVDFNILVDNSPPDGFFADFHVVVTPFGGEPIHDVTHGPIWINAAPDYTKALGILLGEIPPGHYDVEITISCDGTDVTRHHRAFAVVQSVEHLDPDSSPFGLCGGALFHLDISDHSEEGETRLSQLEATGVVWGRNDLWWGEIQPEIEEWDWSKCDSVIDSFVDHGINLLGILCYSTPWMNGEAPVTPWARAAFGHYARRTVERYRDRVHHWEVWNEPNHPEFWHPTTPSPQDYADLLREASAAIREADPDAQIVGVCTSGVPLSFILPVIDAGAAEWMDVLSVHPYQLQSPSEWSEMLPHGQLRQLRAALDERGLEDLPLWITEEGWETIGPADYERQARYLVQFYTEMLASGLVERIYWFNLTDWGAPDDSAGGHYGLVEMDHTPKPSFSAYNNVIARLHDFDTVEDQSERDLGRFRFEFHRPEGADHGEERITVIWTTGEPQQVTIPDGARVISVVGAPIEPIILGVGVHPRTETVRESPIFIVEELQP